MSSSHNPDDEYFIYGLVDPRDDLVKYVGKSLDPSKRLGGHIADTLKRSGRDTPKVAWIRKLISLNMRPTVVVLEKTARSCADNAERRWIASYQGLVNSTNGGEGWDTDSARASALASWARQDRANAMSEFMTQWHAARKMAGIPLHDAESKKKMSEIRKELAKADGAKDQFAAMSRARWSRPGAKERQREALAKARSRRDQQP